MLQDAHTLLTMFNTNTNLNGPIYLRQDQEYNRLLLSEETLLNFTLDPMTYWSA